MRGNDREPSDYYTKLFTESPSYATPFPNPDEAYRWAKICEFLSQIPQPAVRGIGQRLRILDVGCGRGWLTYLANIYGCCNGVDPSAGSIEIARKYFPRLTFYVGTVTDVLRSPEFQPYDVIIASEVIEHITNKEDFVAELNECLTPDGHVIVTTPRAEKFQKYLRAGYALQPIEAWVSEKELYSLFKRHRFVSIRHDRVHIGLPEMSFSQRLSASSKVFDTLDKLGLAWVHKGLQHVTGIYQVWWFQSRRPPAR